LNRLDIDLFLEIHPARCRYGKNVEELVSVYRKKNAKISFSVRYGTSLPGRLNIKMKSLGRW
jgi:hypothetical protein